MPKTIFNPVQWIFTRRALVNVIQSQHDGQKPHPNSTRPRSTFPLILAVGLMTAGVIAIVSLIQLLSSYFG